MIKVKELCASFGFSETFARLLVERGFDTTERAKAFLYPALSDMEDPFRLSGMKEATARIRTAIAAKEKIVIYGDYDCDGITATSILYGDFDPLRLSCFARRRRFLLYPQSF